MVVAQVAFAAAATVETLAGPGLDATEIETVRTRADPDVAAPCGGQRGDVIAAQRVRHGRIVPVRAIAPAAGVAQEQAAAAHANPQSSLAGRQQRADVALADTVGTVRVVRFEAEVAAVLRKPVDACGRPGKPGVVPRHREAQHAGLPDRIRRWPAGRGHGTGHYVHELRAATEAADPGLAGGHPAEYRRDVPVTESAAVGAGSQQPELRVVERRPVDAAAPGTDEEHLVGGCKTQRRLRWQVVGGTDAARVRAHPLARREVDDLHAVRQRGDPQSPALIGVHRRDEGLLAGVIGEVDSLRRATRGVEHDQSFARAGPHPAIDRLVDCKDVVERAGATRQLREREMLEPAARAVPPVDAAPDRADPQPPRHSTVQHIDPVLREAVRAVALVEIAHESAAVRVEPVEAVLCPHPDSSLGVLGDTVDALVAQRARILRVVVKLREIARPWVATIEAAGVGGHPQRAIVGFVQRANVLVADAARTVRVRQERRCLVAVVAEQALARADPQQSVAIDEQGDRDVHVQSAPGPEFGEATRCVGLRR